MLKEKPLSPTAPHKRERVDPPKSETKEDYLTEGLE